MFSVTAGVVSEPQAGENATCQLGCISAPVVQQLCQTETRLQCVTGSAASARVVTAWATQHETACHEPMQRENFPQHPSHHAVTQNELMAQGLGCGKPPWSCSLLTGILEDTHLSAERISAPGEQFQRCQGDEPYLRNQVPVLTSCKYVSPALPQGNPRGGWEQVQAQAD